MTTRRSTATLALFAAQITNNPVSKSPPPPLLHVKSVCVAKLTRGKCLRPMMRALPSLYSACCRSPLRAVIPYFWGFVHAFAVSVCRLSLEVSTERSDRRVEVLPLIRRLQRRDRCFVDDVSSSGASSKLPPVGSRRRRRRRRRHYPRGKRRRFIERRRRRRRCENPTSNSEQHESQFRFRPLFNTFNVVVERLEVCLLLLLLLLLLPHHQPLVVVVFFVVKGRDASVPSVRR